ncbi:MAG TPA: carotenoid biosynthesis protein [Thermodesulfobacteriota bacterium]
MAEVLWLLWQTVLYRPYVFAFLAAFLVAAGVALGAARTARFTATIWLTAFAAEYSSTRTGIPFGFYTYLENTRDRELYVANVPFMDSLSFTFLAFAAYATAIVLRAPRAPGEAASRGPATVALAAALLTLLDVVIDPIALRGDRWFLGLIYAYPHEGFYFGVPAANFAGWFVVGLVGIGGHAAVEAVLARRGTERPLGTGGLRLGVGLYYGVLAFNLAVTFAVGEWRLGAAGLAVTLVPTVALLVRVGRAASGQPQGPLDRSLRESRYNAPHRSHAGRASPEPPPSRPTER